MEFENSAGKEMNFTVRVAEAGFDGKGSIAGVGSWLQDAAAVHAGELGFDNAVLAEKANVVWVLIREYIEMQRYPGYGERVCVSTWPASLERNVGRRDFRIFDAQHQQIGAATSLWATMDLESRKLAPMPDFVAAQYPKTPVHSVELPSRSVKRLREHSTERSIMTRYSDLDSNAHVNNVHYMEWALESLPGSYACRPCSLDIAFRAEARLGDRVLSRSVCEGEAQCRHAVLRDDGVELARIATRWK